jgi:sensor domain CHASE-containing protein
MPKECLNARGARLYVGVVVVVFRVDELIEEFNPFFV